MKTTELPFAVEIPDDLWGRVKLACALRGKNVSWLSLEIGYTEKQALHNIIRQEDVPRGGKVKKMAELLDVPLEWLMEAAKVTRGIRRQMCLAQRQARQEARHE